MPKSKSVVVSVNPRLLIWARETAGYSTAEAAQRLGVKAAKLESIEAADDVLTFSQLKKASSVFKRPLALFFLNEPPANPNVPHDFRMRLGVAHRPYSAPLNFAIRKARLLRDDALNLARELAESVPTFQHVGRLDEAPEQVASRIRRAIGISLEQQNEWQRTDRALRAWKAAVEKLSVLVLEVSRIPTDEMRGLSIPGDTLPVIVLNGGDSLAGRVFTLFHEFTHLLLRQGGVCDLVDAEAASPDGLLEAFCNAVAGATLVPADALLSKVGHGSPQEWSLEQLRELALHFSVSREVILRRLLITERTTAAYYNRLREQFRAEYVEMAAAGRKASGGPEPAVMTIRNLGRPFVRLVLDAYAQDRITLSTASDYLGVKLKHLPRIESLIRQSGPVS